MRSRSREGSPAAGASLETKEARIEEIRLRIREISDQLKVVRAEWTDAHSRRDALCETGLVGRETQLFAETDNLVREFSDLVRSVQGLPKGRK